MGLVTFEQPAWAMTHQEEREARHDLAAEQIHWEPLRYHKRPPVASTLLDIALGAFRCARLASRENARLLHGRGTVPAAMAFLASRVTGAKFLNDADGPLSEEYADAGVWRRGSLPQRMTGWAERQFLVAADAVAVLTERRQREVQRLTGRDAVVLPCAVDTSHFVPGSSEPLRESLGLDGVVLLYAGKAGGWYLTDAMLDFAKIAAEMLGKVTLLVLTTDDPAVFNQPAEARGIRCVVRRASRDEMPRYLAAADAGLSFVLPAPSKAACSPVKNGEYLACGLPIVTTPGIGDYSDLVARRRIGVVVDTLDTAGYRKAALELRKLIDDPEIRARCRNAAVEEIGLSEVVIPRYLSLYQRLLGAPASHVPAS